MATDIGENNIDESIGNINSNIVPTRAGAAAIIKDSSLHSDNKMDDYKILDHPWQIFQNNDWALRKDFELITEGRASCPVPLQTHSSELIFLLKQAP
jgi:hypothetical protein